jgi:hypothetical protein
VDVPRRLLLLLLLHPQRLLLVLQQQQQQAWAVSWRYQCRQQALLQQRPWGWRHCCRTAAPAPHLLLVRLLLLL